MGVIISFCITVFNQSELVRKCIESIIPYKGKDIEIVISDDRSTEDIKGLVSDYNDDRIKYYINDENLGHDRNIVNALSKANGQYAFLLRTRDLIIPSAIPLLIKTAKMESASYITGEGINQNGDLKIQYSKERFMQGIEAINANYKLFIHPSGSMYRLADIDLKVMQEFLDNNMVPKNGFIVHNLIRLRLATTGDFRLIREPVWIYSDTETATDRAVNKSTDGISVYDPSLIENRYQYEMKWAKQILGTEEYKEVLYLLTGLYLDLVTWGFKLTNCDKQSQYHYDYQKKKNFSVSKQRNHFIQVCNVLYDPNLESEKDYKRRMKRLLLKNKTVDAVKYIIRKTTFRTPLYNYVARFYKKVIKGL